MGCGDDDELYPPELHSERSLGVSDLGFGFKILDERAQPIVSLSFKTSDDAAKARAEIAKDVAKVVEALTAAGDA
jgi:hypothetical protein